MKQGFDSRWWNGIMPADCPYLFGYCKATEGNDFTSQQFGLQMLALQNYGKLKGAFMFHRQASDVIISVKRFYDVVRALDVPVELPNVADFEDIRATPGLKLVDHMWATVQEIEQKFQQECMIYSAGWWWDRWAKPYVQDRHEFYEKDLWEADPPPDTPCGEWGEPVVRQVKLDIIVPGFNAALDENEATDEWYKLYACDKPEEPECERAKATLTYSGPVDVEVIRDD